MHSPHPNRKDFLEAGGPLVYLDRCGRPWWMIAANNKPSVAVQRVGCRLSPLDMPRLELVDGSPWSHGWTLTHTDDPRVVRALVDGRL